MAVDEGGLREADDMGPSSSCSSPGDRSYDGEEYSYTLEMTDEPELDGEFGKRLNQMIAVPVSVANWKYYDIFL